MLKIINKFLTKILKTKDVSVKAIIDINVKIGQMTFIDGYTYIGAYTYIGKNCNITKTEIGRYCSIANNVSIGQGEHNLTRISTSSLFYNNAYDTLTKEECIIGNDVWIGTDSIILRGVIIGNGAVVGANSVVTKDVPAFAIVVGSPAKIIRYRFDPEKIEIILKSKWWEKDLGGGKNYNRGARTMKLASFVQTYNLGNKIFDIADCKINRDNYGYFYFKLKDLFKYNGIDLSTCDINEPIKSDIIVYHGLNQKFKKYDEERSYLLAIESPHVDLKAFDIKYHKHFKKIFTWNDDFIDNQKYFKVNYAFDIPKSIPKCYKGKKLCCTIAGNKYANHPDELYTKRIDLIRWFEENHLNEFDLYGVRWDEFNFGKSLFGKILNRLKLLKKLLAPRFPSYKGMVDSKNETMQKYRFAICYENIKDQNGYITEKIFDCFFAGCVPVYWGAKNVTDYIPKVCFIDKRDFDTFEELYRYMKDMDEETYMKYLDAIEDFLNSPKADPFRAEIFANTIVNEIVKDLEIDNS